MSTRENILEAARTLFNEEGVGGQSAVDIATAQGISAGHLYYHFKGKPQILAELMEAHAEEMALVVQAMDEACAGEADVETLWTHVHILVEEAWDARFFWREPALALDNAAVAAAARRVSTGLRAGLDRALAGLRRVGALDLTPAVRDGLAGQMATGVLFHAIALELAGDPGPPRERIARAAAQVMLPAAAFAAS